MKKFMTKKNLLLNAIGLFAALGCGSASLNENNSGNSKTSSYTCTVQAWTVPAECHSIEVKARDAGVAELEKGTPPLGGTSFGDKLIAGEGKDVDANAPGANGLVEISCQQ